MLIALIRRMIGTLHVDYSQSIAAIQKQVEAVRMLRIRTTQWAVLCGTLLWVPWLAVVSQGFLGVDIYRSVDEAWVIGNVLFGLALFRRRFGRQGNTQTGYSGLRFSSV
jgi:hypothetical protein